MVAVWQGYVANATKELQGFGLTKKDLNVLNQVLKPKGAQPDYYTFATSTNKKTPPWMTHNPTWVPDAPYPVTIPYELYQWTALLPEDWLHTPNASHVLMEFVKAGSGSFQYILGGEIARSSDGMSAVSEAYRQASFMVSLDGKTIPLFRASMEQYKGKNSYEDSNFPGGTEYNHIGADEMGPLKSDWTKVCPDEWTMGQRNAKCVSLQESVWGTQTLEKLENIKKQLDPHYRMQCFDCVGFKMQWSDEEHLQKKLKTSGRWCVNSTNGGGCSKWVDKDPADVVQKPGHGT